MKIQEAVGRITKQNQTADVGPDEIIKQAAKFGFKVNKDGVPQNHPKKVKGPSTNVLFNLGLAEAVSYNKPNFSNEWGEAKRYPEFVKIGKKEWIELASKGKEITVNNSLSNKINNTEAGEKDRHTFDKLEPSKKERFKDALDFGKIELPIIAKYSDGYLELVAGNTRLTGMMNELGKGKAWIFDVPDEIANLSERVMTTKQAVAQMNHYWKNMSHAMVSDNDKKRSMDKRFGIKDIKLDQHGNIISFDKYKRGQFEQAGSRTDENPLLTLGTKALQWAAPRASSLGAQAGAAIGSATQWGKNVAKNYKKGPGKSTASGNTDPNGPTILPKVAGTSATSTGGTEYKPHKTVTKLMKVGEVSADDLSSESEVFVDMDGVLADFFGAWKSLIGKDWREIKDIDDALQKIRDKDGFWLNIPLTSNALNLLGMIKELKGKYNILSAPLPNDPNSEPHKKEWIAKNLKAFPPSKIIITSNKSVHATQPNGTPNILIDDYGKNIASWEAAGGVGFKHKDHKFERTVKNLKAHMSEEMSKSSIKKAHKTADKIKDKPKAKKSIAKWAKKRGMDPDGAIYAIATNMQKRKEGKPVESYKRSELPQIRKEHLKKFPHVIEYVNVKDLIPVQEERVKDNFKKQLKKISEGKYSPIVVDAENKIINGHHRYDIVKMLEMEKISVAKVPFTLKHIMITLNEGKSPHKKGTKKYKKHMAAMHAGMGEDEFKPHMMYDPKTGKGYKAKKEADHLRMKKLGYTHDNPKTKKVEEGDLIPNPKNSMLIKKDDNYDWYNIGTNMANIKSMDRKHAKKNKPDVMVTMQSGKGMKNYLKKHLKRLGYGVQDADGYKDTHYDESANKTETYTLAIKLR